MQSHRPRLFKVQIRRKPYAVVANCKLTQASIESFSLNAIYAAFEVGKLDGQLAASAAGERVLEGVGDKFVHNQPQRNCLTDIDHQVRRFYSYVEPVFVYSVEADQICDQALHVRAELDAGQVLGAIQRLVQSRYRAHAVLGVGEYARNFRVRTGFPTISSALYPKVRAAPVFHVEIRAASSTCSRA